jgi:hypothetical protein
MNRVEIVLKLLEISLFMEIMPRMSIGRKNKMPESGGVLKSKVLEESEEVQVRRSKIGYLDLLSRFKLSSAKEVQEIYLEVKNK